MRTFDAMIIGAGQRSWHPEVSLLALLASIAEEQPFPSCNHNDYAEE